MNILKDINFYYENHKNLRNYSNEKLIEFHKKFIEFVINNKVADLELFAYQEILNINNKNIKYHIIKTDTIDKIKIFCIYISLYNLLSKKIKSNYILPLDFEFNTKKVALMQLNFETDFNDRLIFIIYPPQLSKYWNSFLIKKILGNQRILKILHGSEALDIPYMFDDLIVKKKYIHKFVHSFIDTRYICEFYNFENNYTERKCKIYDLLLDQKIVSQKKIDELENNSKKMGPIYDIIIDINNISLELLKYTLYDVIFLRYLYDNFPKNEIYDKLIPELTRFNILERRQVTQVFKNVQLEINKMNNFFIKDMKNIKLIEIYQLYENYLNINDFPIKTLNHINYFKHTIEILKKYVVYKNVIKNYQIFINNKSEFKQNLSEIIINNNFKIINKILNAFDLEIKKSL